VLSICGMKAIVESAGNVASQVRLGRHALTFDQPRSVRGGEDRGPSPLDVFVASVAACAHYFGAAYLTARGLDASALVVEAHAEKERVPVPHIGHLSLKVRVPPGLDDAHLAGIVRAIKGCPAYGTLVQPPVVELDVDAPAVTPLRPSAGARRGA
jgi:uncharacterized OsmC-like protein